MQTERRSSGFAAPPGVPGRLWAMLLVVLALSGGLASWRVSSVSGSVELPELITAQEPEGRRPLRVVAVRWESLGSVRARLAHGGTRTPAGEVDEWTLRLATSPPYREETRRALERMRHLEQVIRVPLAREGIPRDLLYLALVESSYRPAATSRAGAAGVWQFMPATARGYGLEVGPWVDERRDPVRASRAAARHLRDLRDRVGSWHLALAAYNCGAGCVERAVRLHGGGGRGDLLYWRVRPHLPRETREYVPRLLAAARIARDPAAFGFSATGDAPLAYREVLVSGGTGLGQVARWAGVPVAHVAALNPHLVRGQTPPGRRWLVRLPLLQPDSTMHGEPPTLEATELSRAGQREREGAIQDRIVRPLLEAGELAPRDVDEAYQAAAADRERRSAIFHLVEMERLTVGRALEVLGRVFGVETVSLAAERPHRGVLELIDGETARQLRVVPLRVEGRDLWVANGDPYDLASLSRIRDITGLSPVPLLADDHSLDTLLRTAYAGADKLHRVMGEAQRSGARVRARASISDEIENAVRGAQVPRMVEAFIEDAVKKRASDVHFEFFDHQGRIRYRIDGQLVVARELDPTWGREIVNRIKVLSGLNSAQDRIPEDGRMKHVLEDGAEVELRVSTLPTDWGCEHAVLRVLARAQTPVELSSVGMAGRDHTVFAEAVERPQGMILVTGPTGSGKSTTLYAALDHLNDPARSIITIEDPVERKIRGIRQTSVGASTGMTFATALRSILRQDPDVIMVGEIRDAETAGTAVKAAMTGHLLLSTLHTNDAPSTVARLLDIGIEPYNLVDALSLVVAQRLVRRICPRCRGEYAPSAHELSRAGLARAEAAEIPFRAGAGCSYCNRSGYFGRIGVFEMMPLSPALRDAIVARRPGAELRALAVAEGMTTLRQAGIERMRAGETTLAEVTRETMQG